MRIEDIFKINIQGFDTVRFNEGFYVFEAGVSRFKFPGQDKSIVLPAVGNRIDLPNGDVAQYKYGMWSVFCLQKDEIYRANSVEVLPGNEYVFKNNINKLWYSPNRVPELASKNALFYGNGYRLQPFPNSINWSYLSHWDKRLTKITNDPELYDHEFEFYDDGHCRLLLDFEDGGRDLRHDFLYNKEGDELCRYPSIRRVNGDLYVATKNEPETAFLFSINKEAVTEQDDMLYRAFVQEQSREIELNVQGRGRLIDWMMILARLKNAYDIRPREVSHAENLATHYYMTQLGYRTY